MAFTVPNLADAAFADQAGLDSRDLDIINGGEAITGVISGGAVTAQGAPNMTVQVSAAVVRIGGRKVAVAASASLTISTANATNPRFDLIVAGVGGTFSVATGTAAASPTLPTIPANSVVVAAVYVPANDASIAANQITDKRLICADTFVENVKWYGAQGDTKTVTDGAMTSGSAVLTSATAAFTPADVGKTIQVARALSTSGMLSTTVASVTNATTAVLAVPAAFSLTGQAMYVDGRTVGDAVTTANSATVTSATAAFTAADVDKVITIGAIPQGSTGAQSMALNTTILSYTSPTQVTLSANATRTCTGSQVVWGTNDTAAVQAAMNVPNIFGVQTCVYAPAGTYLIGTSVGGVGSVSIYSNTWFRGDGWGTVFRSIGVLTAPAGGAEMFGINAYTGVDSNPANNSRNILISNMHMQGTAVEDGFREGLELLSMSSASDVTVRDVKFSNFRSDGIYIGMGASTSGLDRHNQHIKVLYCLFDGVNFDNRNPITIIDCDDLLIEGNSFINSTRPDMPGAIDIEPNAGNTTSIVRSIRIRNNHFWKVGGNAGIVAMQLTNPQRVLTTPMHGLEVASNFFGSGVGLQLGITLQQLQYPTDSTPRNDVLVTNNIMQDIGGNWIELEGVKGVEFRGNILRDCLNSAAIGFNKKCLDIVCVDNLFSGVGAADSYAIQLIQVDRVVIDSNTFEQIGIPPAGSQGFVLRLNQGSSLPTPAAPTLTAATTGGTLAAGTKSYRVAALRDNLTTTLASTAATIATTGTTSAVTVSWAEEPGAAQYRVYGRTSGSELLIATLPVGTLSYVDTGSVTPAGAVPGANTTLSGNTNGIQFTNNIIRQGSSNLITAIVNKTANHTTVNNNLQYWNNRIPGNATLAIAPFIDSTISYTITASALAVDVSQLPSRGNVVLTGSTTTAAGALTITGPTIGQVLTFEFVIPTLNFTYATAANMKFAGAAAAAHTLTAGRRDIYTFRFDGTNWNEISRSINVG